MEYENEGSQPDVQSPESSTEQDYTAPQETQEQQAPPEVPFHEHPRFKELVEQKNQYSTQLKQYEQEMSRMRHEMSQFKQSQPAKPNPDAELYNRLKGIDPVFGSKFEAVSSAAERMQQMQSTLQQMEATRIQDQYTSGISKLFSENNVPREWQEIYDAKIERIARSDSKLGLQDLPRVFKEVHDSFSKMFEQAAREDRKNYVQDKTKAAQLPTSQPKGKPAGTQKESLPVDREARNQAIAKAAVAKFRAGSNI